MHVVFLMQQQYDASGPEEEQGFKESMDHEVKNGGRPGTHAERQKHVSDLTDGGIGQHPLQVVLGKSAEPRYQQGGCSYHGNGCLHKRSQDKQCVRTGNQVNTGSYHGGGVDKCAHGRRARHGIRKPGLERQLCRFSKRSAQEQEGGRNRKRRSGTPFFRQLVHQGIDIQCAEGDEQQEETEDHESIADTGNNKSFAGRIIIFGILIPESDQQVTAQPHAFPAQIHQQQVVRQHKNQHGTDKKVHIREEPGESFIPPHEFHRVQVNEGAHKCDDKTEHERQGIKPESNIGTESPGIEPVIKGSGIGTPVRGK